MDPRFHGGDIEGAGVTQNERGNGMMSEEMTHLKFQFNFYKREYTL